MYDVNIEPKQVSNILNEFRIGKKVAKNSSNALNNEILNVNNNVYFDNLFFKKKNENSDVIKMFHDFKDDSSAGTD